MMRQVPVLSSDGSAAVPYNFAEIGRGHADLTAKGEQMYRGKKVSPEPAFG